MPPTSLDTRIRDCVEQFASDLTSIITRAALEAVRGALASDNSLGAPRLAPRLALSEPAPQTRSSKGTRVSAGSLRETDIELSLDEYARHAILRALDENDGNALAAAAALGLSKSAMYRHMKLARIPRPRGPVDVAAVSPSGYLRLDGPVNLDSYERRAIERALEQSGGQKRTAAQALGIGLSTIHRRCQVLGVG